MSAYLSYVAGAFATGIPIATLVLPHLKSRLESCELDSLSKRVGIIALEVILTGAAIALLVFIPQMGLSLLATSVLSGALIAPFLLVRAELENALTWSLLDEGTKADKEKKLAALNTKVRQVFLCVMISARCVGLPVFYVANTLMIARQVYFMATFKTNFFPV